jgi:Na+/proline symporter
MRLMVSLISLVLFFYLAGQLVSGVVMFEIMLGLDSMWALGITTFILLIYVVLGGAHADILTDGVQGFMMLLLAVLVIILTALGWGVEGGFSGIVDNLANRIRIWCRLPIPIHPCSIRGGLSSSSPLRICRWVCCRTSATSCGHWTPAVRDCNSSNSPPFSA